MRQEVRQRGPRRGPRGKRSEDWLEPWPAELGAGCDLLELHHKLRCGALKRKRARRGLATRDLWVTHGRSLADGRRLGSKGLLGGLPLGSKGRLTGDILRTYRADRSINYTDSIPLPQPRTESDYWNGSLQISWEL